MDKLSPHWQRKSLWNTCVWTVLQGLVHWPHNKLIEQQTPQTQCTDNTSSGPPGNTDDNGRLFSGVITNICVIMRDLPVIKDRVWAESGCWLSALKLSSAIKSVYTCKKCANHNDVTLVCSQFSRCSLLSWEQDTQVPSAICHLAVSNSKTATLQLSRQSQQRYPANFVQLNAPWMYNIQ